MASYYDLSFNLDFVTDEIISQLLMPSSDPKKMNKIPDSFLLALCEEVKFAFMKQPMLLELNAPVKIIGDIHGQLKDLIRHFDQEGYPPASKYLFLGNYVDRGDYSVETIALLFAYKVKYPENIFLLRGNHEDEKINSFFGFKNECTFKHNVKVYRTFNDSFNCMPVAAIVGEKIFCCHGGISPSLGTLQDINDIRRPCTVPNEGLLCDLLWSDPCEESNIWRLNHRGCSYTFGERQLYEFLNKHNLDAVCRGHQFVEDGYQYFANRKLITLFSAPHYRNRLNNKAAVLKIYENLLCNFSILKP